MKISFKIDCTASEEEKIVVIGSLPELGNWDVEKGLLLKLSKNHEWETWIKVKQIIDFEYRYVTVSKNNEIKLEGRENRTFIAENKNYSEIRFRDYWRPKEKEDVIWQTKAFKNILTRRIDLLTKPSSEVNSEKILRIQVNGTSTNPTYDIGLIGDTNQLGNWDENKYLALSNVQYPFWHIDLDASKINYPLKYKYILINRKTKKIIKQEEGEERMIQSSGCANEDSYLKVHSDDKIRGGKGPSRLAGISLGIWQLRDEESIGVGDFYSLKNMIKWCHNTGQRIIHILPINDVASYPRSERIYPFETKSAYAINPILLNCKMLGSSFDKEGYINEIIAYEKNETIEFEQITKIKIEYAKKIFSEEKEQFLKSEEAKEFINENKEWLLPFAVFESKTKKGKGRLFKDYSMKKVEQLFDPKNRLYNDLIFILYIQFHLQKQLKEVVQFARNYGIILDIEIPTTISTNSVETWQYKSLFDKQHPLGILPNKGEQIDVEWDVASCNWKRMEATGYEWWKNLFNYYGTFFDACRLSDIDTIFRTWHIPKGALQSRLGYYDPAIPYEIDELIDQEFWYEDNMSKPFIREYFLEELFGMDTEEVKGEFFDEIEQGQYQFKNKFFTQEKIEQYFIPDKEKDELTPKEHKILFGLKSLHREVLFIVDEWDKKKIHPRINFHETYAFINLPEDQRIKMESICGDYYKTKHNDTWLNEAKKILSSLSSNCPLLLSVDNVSLNIKGQSNIFQELGILSEEVQRISRHNEYEFIRANEASYLSIMYSSKPKGQNLYSWWKNQPEDAKRYMSHVLESNQNERSKLDRRAIQNIVLNQWEGTSMAVLLTLHDLLLLGEELPNIEKDTLLLRMKNTTKDLLNNENLNRWLSEYLKKSKRFM